MANNLKISWRNMLRDRMHATINVAGLVLGLTVALLIGLWIHQEVSFNKELTHHARITQVIQNQTNNGQVETWFSVPYPLAEELRRHYGASFRYVAMGGSRADHLITIGTRQLKTTGGFFEKDMTAMLDLEMVEGSREISDPTGIVVSQSTAKAWFGNAGAMGKTLSVEHWPLVRITGIYRDLPVNSSFGDLGFLGAWQTYYTAAQLNQFEDPWRPNFVSLYAELKDDADLAAVSARIRPAKFNRLNDHLKQKNPALFLFPMDRWHLYSEYQNGMNTGGAIQYVRMFGLVGVFVLLLACINFMNLSTARSQKRAREVGIRKTLGSNRAQLIWQFFSESGLTVAVAFALSLLCVFLILPAFSEISGKQIRMPLNEVWFWIACLGFICVTTGLSGSYPALYLSSFKPISTLGGKFRAGNWAGLPRQILVVVQFSVSVALIVGTVVVYRQIQYSKDRPTGYSSANLLSITTGDSTTHAHIDALRQELIGSGDVLSMAESESPLTNIFNSTSGFSWPGKSPTESIDFQVITVSGEYGNTVGWHVKEGRGFSRDFLTDSTAVILNEAALRYMRLKDPVGTPVSWWGRPLTVIGVVENMLMGSPYAEADPAIYVPLSYPGNRIIAKLNPRVSVHDAIARIGASFTRFSPAQPFEYSFVSEDFARKFQDEERVGRLSAIFAVLAIVISCLGLFGLTSFVAEQRKKEIGIRKVLGASVSGLWMLLSREFIFLVLISFAISLPASYLVMHAWLRNYVYHTAISGWILVAAAMAAILITAITVSFQSIRAALTNPVHSLRSE